MAVTSAAREAAGSDASRQARLPANVNAVSTISVRPPGALSRNQEREPASASVMPAMSSVHNGQPPDWRTNTAARPVSPRAVRKWTR